MTHCHIIPPYLLERLAAGHPDEAAARFGQQTLVIDARLRERRTVPAPSVQGSLPPQAAQRSGEDAIAVYTAGNGSDLPGQVVRVSGDPESGDVSVDEAYAGVDGTLALFREVYSRESYDGRGAPVVATVHYERNYDNAFWDGRQLVFGDGDGTVFGRFTKPVDVLGHEFTHAVTQFTANLTYQGQSGALNESVSDVFGSCLKQRLLGQSADQADWLIGAGIFLPAVQGKALRSMSEPGTAYDDDVIGKDPQVGSMVDYVDTQDDNGGVHLNSGIPNRAFYLAATGIGGSSWDGAGRIWYAALTSGIGADTDFAAFAAATITAAEAVSSAAADAVRGAWDEVGVTGSGAAPAPSGSAGAGTVRVTRSGGFAGIRQTGELTLGDDPRTPEVESLLGRIDVAMVAPPMPAPDRFVYTFDLGGQEVIVGEQDLTPDLHQLAQVLLTPPE
jgi:Thermolysin metallopeptidase, alpha-helical domain/Thermolysin metallopeptidase, catalytic domain